MRDMKPAERLLSLLTSPDNASGIVGDLSEERGQRGSMWFWRQVLGTMLSLCRGVLFESPLIVLPLVIAGYVLLMAIFQGFIYAGLNLFKPYGLMFMARAFVPLAWTSHLLVGMTLVAVAGRRGMVACVLLATLGVFLSIRAACILIFTSANSLPTLPFWLIHTLATTLLLLLGGALIRRRQNRKLLRTS